VQAKYLTYRDNETVQHFFLAGQDEMESLVRYVWKTAHYGAITEFREPQTVSIDEGGPASRVQTVDSADADFGAADEEQEFDHEYARRCAETEHIQQIAGLLKQTRTNPHQVVVGLFLAWDERWSVPERRVWTPVTNSLAPGVPRIPDPRRSGSDQVHQLGRSYAEYIARCLTDLNLARSTSLKAEAARVRRKKLDAWKNLQLLYRERFDGRDPLVDLGGEEVKWRI